MQTIKVSDNTIRIGRECGYYNAVSCFRFRLSILPDKYFNEDAADRAREEERFNRCACLCEKVAAKYGIMIN